MSLFAELSPAKVSSVDIHAAVGNEKPRVDVFLKPEEVSKAIGKGGVNIRLASMLTGYEIDVQRDDIEDVYLTESLTRSRAGLLKNSNASAWIQQKVYWNWMLLTW